jgi:uncharacterized repeat protein (TIGR02543 family)
MYKKIKFLWLLGLLLFPSWTILVFYLLVEPIILGIILQSFSSTFMITLLFLFGGTLIYGYLRTSKEIPHFIHKYEIQRYFINFESNGGTPVSPIQAKYDELIAYPFTSKPNHSFAGWYQDKEFKRMFVYTEKMPAKDLILYARWIEPIQNLKFSLSAFYILTKNGSVYSSSLNLDELLSTFFDHKQREIKISKKKFSILKEEKICEIKPSFLHTAFFTTKGQVFLTGNNSYGQLGSGFLGSDRSKNYSINKRIEFDKFENVDQISLGLYHTGVLTSNHRLFMFGNNEWGQLGVENLNQALFPINVTSSFSLKNKEKIVSVELGTSHSGVLTNHHRVFLWGLNRDGQIEKSNSNLQSLPVDVTKSLGLMKNEHIQSIHLGSIHTCFLTSKNRVLMIGKLNRLKTIQHASNSISPIDISQYLFLKNDETIVKVEMSGFNLAIITSQGRLFLWGDNQQQQLGFKSVKVILIPKEIPIEIYDPTKETFKSIQFLTNKTILVLKDEQIIVLGHFKNQLPVIRCHYGMFYPPMVISKSNIS